MPVPNRQFRILVGMLSAATLAAGGCRRAPRTAAVPPAPMAPPTYAAGTTVAGVPVGGLTYVASRTRLRQRLSPLAGRTVHLTYGAHVYPRRWNQVGITPDVNGMLLRAWREPTVPLSVAFDVPKAGASIRRVARALNIAPVEPHFVGPPPKGWVKPGRTGRRVDVGASAVLLRNTVLADPSTRKSPLVVVPDEPDFTVDDLRAINVCLVSYTTRFNPREGNRTHNLRLVSQRLNGALVKPGEVFSFNDWVGERLPSDGFREAIVYKYGKMVRDTGGGLCQVSSTLYNVALLTGFPIRQRSHHSLTVHYVPLGRDATVYWGTADLRFKNDTQGPVYFRTRAGRSALTIEAWGTEPLTRKVQVTSSSSWRSGKAMATVYRVIAENGRKTRERISQDAYETQHVMASARTPSKRT